MVKIKSLEECRETGPSDIARENVNGTGTVVSDLALKEKKLNM